MTIRESCLALHTGHTESDKSNGKEGQSLYDTSQCNLVEYEINPEDWIACLFCFNICIANH